MQVPLAAAVRSPRNFFASHESASPLGGDLGGDLGSSPFIRSLLLGVSSALGGDAPYLPVSGLGGPPS
jgi:hypothetical protein